MYTLQRSLLFRRVAHGTVTRLIDLLFVYVTSRCQGEESARLPASTAQQLRLAAIRSRCSQHSEILFANVTRYIQRPLDRSHFSLDYRSDIDQFKYCGTGILKDVPDFPLVMIYKKERDSKRMALFPSLDYRGLYTVLIQLLEVAPLIQTGVDGNN